MANCEQGKMVETSIVPKKASNADFEGKTLPITMYEVVQTTSAGKIVRAEVKPITVIRFGIDHQAGAKPPSIFFIDSDGETCRGSVSMFYLEEAEAKKEVDCLMAFEHLPANMAVSGFVEVNQMTGNPVSEIDMQKAAAPHDNWRIENGYKPFLGEPRKLMESGKSTALTDEERALEAAGDQGRSAHDQGVSLKDNPYPAADVRHEWWQDGWVGGAEAAPSEADRNESSARARHSDYLDRKLQQPYNPNLLTQLPDDVVSVGYREVKPFHQAQVFRSQSSGFEGTEEQFVKAGLAYQYSDLDKGRRLVHRGNQSH